MSQPLTPKGGEDRVYTPELLACQICEHFMPSGIVVEPCRGKGAFLAAFKWLNTCQTVHSYEIEEGRTFWKQRC